MNDRTATTGNSIDLSEMTPAHLRHAMGWLGYELPVEIGPADVAAAMALLEVLPPDALAMVLNPDMRVDFARPVPMPSVPQVFPYNGGLTSTAAVETSLSNVQVHPGFDPRHTFEVSAELTGGWNIGAGRTDLNRITRALEQYSPAVLEPFQDTIERWPRVRDFARGPDWMRGSFNYEAFEGGRLSYEAVVPPSVAAEIDAGNLTAIPNPLQPMEMPIGSAVIIRGESLEGSTSAFTYRFLRADETTTELEGMAFGITRISDTDFELTTGPFAAVEYDRYLGLGVSSLSTGIGVAERREGGSVDVVHLDLSTPQGQSAYQDFMQRGAVPESIGPGVVDIATRLQIRGDASMGPKANLFGTSIGSASDTDFEKTLTTFADGTSEQRATLVGASNRVGFDVVQRYGTDEQLVPGSREWTVLLEDMSAASGAYLQTAYSGQGYDPDMPGGTFAELRFSDEELMQLRDAALARLGLEQPEDYAQIESHRDEETPIDRMNDSRDMLQRLAAANSPEEVFELGFMYHSASPEDIAAVLNSLSMASSLDPTGAEITMPGSLEIRDAALHPIFPPPLVETLSADSGTPIADSTVAGREWLAPPKSSRSGGELPQAGPHAQAVPVGTDPAGLPILGLAVTPPASLSPASEALLLDCERWVSEIVDRHRLPWSPGMDNTVYAMAQTAREAGLTGITHFKASEGTLHLAQHDGFTIRETRLNSRTAANTPKEQSREQLQALDCSAPLHDHEAAHKTPPTTAGTYAQLTR